MLVYTLPGVSKLISWYCGSTQSHFPQKGMTVFPDFHQMSNFCLLFDFWNVETTTTFTPLTHFDNCDTLFRGNNYQFQIPNLQL